ncbi:MAG: hypothetical protein AAGN82_02540 [Myxococcota bacterium]
MTLRRDRRVLVAVAVASICLPLLFDAAVHGPRRVYDYFVADAFAYLTVARNGLVGGHPSFDQIHPTNGFHPLWQVILMPWVRAGTALGLDHVVLLWSVFAMGLVLTASGLGFLLAAACDRNIPRGEMLLTVAGLGAMTGLALPLHRAFDGRPSYASTWAAVNGMETSLLVFFFGLTAWIFTRGGGRAFDRRAWGLGFAITGLALSRLDHTLMSLVYVAALFARAWLRRSRQALAGAVATALPLVVVMTVYAAYNVVVFGAAVPISGRIKSSFPFLADTFPTLIAVLKGSQEAWSGRLVRLLPLIVPMGVGAVFIALGVRLRYAQRVYTIQFRSRRRFSVFLWLSCIGTGGLGVYNALFVPLFSQGTWYHAVANLTATIALAEGFGRLPGWRRLARTRPGLVASATVSLALVAVTFWARFPAVGHHHHYARLDLDEGPRIVAHYRNAYGGERFPYVLSFDDGIVAWSLPFPTMSRSLLLDPVAYRSMRRDNLCVMQVAVARGFDHITSIDYWPPEQLRTDHQIRRIVAARTRCSEDVMNDYRFHVDYRSGDGRMLVVRASKRSPP